MIAPRCLKGMSTLRRASSDENSVSVPLAIAHEQASVASFHRDATGRPRTRSVEEVVDRGMLITLAHRRLGGAADAEDIVQETYLRWYRLTAAERQLIQSPVAWCVRVATRLSLDLLNSARRRHEHNLGSGLPDGAVASFDGDLASASIDPADVITLDESVSLAMLVVLESMTPAERVPFVLHDVFQYSFREIGEIVGRSAPACRQLATSARRRLGSAGRASCDGDEHTGQVDDVRAAFECRDVYALVELLDPGLSTVHGGGGRPSKAGAAGRHQTQRRRRPQMMSSQRSASGETRRWSVSALRSSALFPAPTRVFNGIATEPASAQSA